MAAWVFDHNNRWINLFRKQGSLGRFLLKPSRFFFKKIRQRLQKRLQVQINKQKC